MSSKRDVSDVPVLPDDAPVVGPVVVGATYGSGVGPDGGGGPIGSCGATVVNIFGINTAGAATGAGATRDWPLLTVGATTIGVTIRDGNAPPRWKNPFTEKIGCAGADANVPIAAIS